MHYDYMRVIKSISWILGEIIRLGKKGTIPELAALADTLDSARASYRKKRREIREESKIV